MTPGEHGTRQYRQTRRADATRDTRARLLAAARQVIIDSGYQRASLEAVASAAGVTRVTIYHQFGSKAELLQALADDLTTRGRAQRITKTADETDPTKALLDLVTEQCRFWAVDPALLRAVTAATASDATTSSLVDLRESWRRQALSTLIARLARAERIRDPYTTDTATGTLLALTSFAVVDSIASALHRSHRSVPALLIPMINGVVDLDPRDT
jgi:AcrR family transcriptional regulator